MYIYILYIIDLNYIYINIADISVFIEIYCVDINIHIKFVQNGETVITSRYKKSFDSFTRFLKLYHV